MEYKGYQKETIKRIVNNYVNGKNNRMLVADEVGLGKTIVAKGVIRCLLYKKYLEAYKIDPSNPLKEFKVMYLCSNLNIAEQNNRKLGVRSKKTASKENKSAENRITMLFAKELRGSDETITFHELKKEYEKVYGDDSLDPVAYAGIDEGKVILQILPITPKTSINLDRAGCKVEREFIHRMLNKMEILSDNPYELELIPGYDFSYLDNEENELKIKGFRELFQKYFDKKYNSEERQKLLEAIRSIDKPEDATKDVWTENWKQMRIVFAFTTLKRLCYDLVILDEFQNFKDVLNNVNEINQRRQQNIDCMTVLCRILENQHNDKYATFLRYMKEKYSIPMDQDVNKRIEKDTDGWCNALENYEKEHADWYQKEIGDDFEIREQFREIAFQYIICCKGEETRDVEELDKKKKALEWTKKLWFKDGVGKLYQEITGAYEVLEKVNLVQKYDIEYSNQKIEHKEFAFNDKKNDNYKYIADLNQEILDWREAEHFIELYQSVRKIYGETGRLLYTPFHQMLALHIQEDGYRNLAFNAVIQILTHDEVFKHNIPGAKVIGQYMWQYYQVFDYIDKQKSFVGYADLIVPKLEVLRKLMEKTQSGDITEGDLENSENIIIKQIFNREYSDNHQSIQILMLSATPFRMYLNQDADTADVDINTICDFLDSKGTIKLSKSLIDYKNSLEQYAKDKTYGKEQVLEKKALFQNKMCGVFSRMERMAVIRELNTNWFRDSVENNADSELPCGKIQELYAYICEVGKFIDKKSKKMITYAEKAPYIFSFMYAETNGRTHGDDEIDGYIIKHEFDKKAGAQEVEIPFTDARTYHAKSYILKKDYDEKARCLGGWHGVFAETLNKMLNLGSLSCQGMSEVEKTEIRENHPGAARLLWIPSSVHKDGLQGAFKEHSEFGKTILFSRFGMVPRMIAGLVSYEAERRLIWFLHNQKEKPKGFDWEKLRNFIYKGKKDAIREALCSPDGIQSICEKAVQEYYNKKDVDNSCKAEYIDNLTRSLTEAIVDKVFLKEPIGLLAVWSAEGIPEGLPDGLKEEKERFVCSNCEKVKKYCRDGNLHEVLVEWFYLCFDAEEELEEFVGMAGEKSLSFLKSTRLQIDMYEEQKGRILPCEKTSMKNYFARCVGNNKDDDNISSIANIQKAFNSPFAPFVFATTSIGQEGLDFHYYADQIVHWDLPSNPIDFEQREGRINRYNCLAIRRKLIEWYAGNEEGTIFDIFEAAMKNAEPQSDNAKVKCGMLPHWVLHNNTHINEIASTKRIVPYFYNSEMLEKYHHNLKVLQLYRSVIGQSNPDEVMERLMENRNWEEVQDLFIDFSPYNQVFAGCKIGKFER